MPGPFLADLLAVGLAKEATFGTFATSALWLPCHDINIEKKPNVILPELFRQNRSPYSAALQGIEEIAGDIVAPLFPDAGMMLLAGAIGADGACVGSTPTGSTTLAAAASAGANSISATATLGSVGAIIQIDSNASGIAECHKILSISGAGPYTITFAAGETLARAHANAAAVAVVVAPFTHTLSPANALPSFSVEKNMNGMDIQYSGMVVSKAALKLGIAADAEMTYSFMGQKDQVIASPVAPVWPTDIAYGPTQQAISIGASDLTVSTLDITLDNGTKVEKTFNTQDYPQFVVPITRKVTLKATAFLQALTGGAPSAGYYADLVAAPSRAIAVTFTNGANIVTINLPAAVLTLATNPVKRGELVQQTLEYDAILGGTPLTDINVTVQNGQYLSY